MTKRRSFSDKFKATVALEALRGDKTAQEIAAKHKIHPTQVTTWKRQAIDGLTGVFSDKVRKAEDNEAEVKELHAKIGKLAVENDFLSQGLKRCEPPLVCRRAFGSNVRLLFHLGSRLHRTSPLLHAA